MCKLAGKNANVSASKASIKPLRAVMHHTPVQYELILALFFVPAYPSWSAPTLSGSSTTTIEHMSTPVGREPSTLPVLSLS